jgi:hypothetical protein
MSCPCGKITFTSRNRAKLHARRFRHKRAGVKLRAYLCPRCSMWHLTSKPRRVRRVTP